MQECDYSIFLVTYRFLLDIKVTHFPAEARWLDIEVVQYGFMNRTHFCRMRQVFLIDQVSLLEKLVW